MKLKPLSEILAMSKEAKDKMLAPIRARKIKAKAELEQARLDESLASLEASVHEECAKEDVDFERIMSKLDDIALKERKKKQLDRIVNELFP